MRRTVWLSLLTAGAAIFLVGLAQTSKAVPAWGRKTGMPCVACHFGGSNRLTQTGVEFLLRGHRTKDDSGIQEGGKDLNLLHYMSFASKVRFTANNTAPAKTGFDVESLSIYAGGPLMDRFSFFFEMYLHERGKTTSSTGGTVDTATRTKLADAYLAWHSAPDTDRFTFVRAGQVYPYQILTYSSGARATISRPSIINDDQGGGNAYTPRDRAYGLTAGYADLAHGLSLELGLVNSGGTNKMANLEEQNAFKDVFFTADKALDSNGSAVGLYLYNGRIAISGTPAWEDRFTRYGILSRYQTADLAISGAYIAGTDQLQAGGHRNPNGYFLEVAGNLQPTLTVFARYDHQYNDLGATSRRTGVVVGVSQRVSGVGRLALELSGTSSGPATYRRQVQAELNWLF